MTLADALGICNVCINKQHHCVNVVLINIIDKTREQLKTETSSQLKSGAPNGSVPKKYLFFWNLQLANNEKGTDKFTFYKKILTIHMKY